MRRLLLLVGPGLMVAATGVGAGDLATSALQGADLGVVLGWAILLGALFKYAASEGLARCQLASGETMLEGVHAALGPWPLVLFLAYLVFWSMATAWAVAGACAAAAHALAPIVSPEVDRWIYGTAHSAAAAVLVAWGGFNLFERVMSAAIAIMFLTTFAAAAMLAPDWGAVAAGFLPSPDALTPQLRSGAMQLIGGVGGTVTLLSYGYWIRESGRGSLRDLPTCRIDLAVGFIATAAFGVAMLTIGAAVAPLEGSGAGLLAKIGDLLGARLGPAIRWMFLLGAWAAVASSLLGVWQSTPYLFVDCIRLLRRKSADEPAYDPCNRRSRWYLLALAFLTVVAVPGMGVGFRSVQAIYTITGALFVPLMCLAVLMLGNRRRLGREAGASRGMEIALATVIVFFVAWGVAMTRELLK